VSQAQAQTELTAIAADLQRAYPDTNKNRDLFVRTELQARMAQDPPDAVLTAMLSTLALLVLFVACANVAGLLTSRAPARAREMALRLAIGAGRGRLVRQLITESLLIAAAGGAAGLAVGYAGMMLFRQIEVPSDLPIALAFNMDRRALVFSLMVSVVSALIFGLVPAVQATRTDLTAVMKSGDSTAPGRRRRWGRAVLVGGQVAVSVVLLVVAMFMYRGFREQLADGPGYRTDHLLLMKVDPSLVRYSDAQSEQFFKQVAERARQVPGVTTVTLTTSIPMWNDTIGGSTIAPEGYRFPAGKESVNVISTNIDEHYFDAMGIPILKGRNILETDDTTSPRVAIVNQHLADHYWPNQDPIGKRFGWRRKASRGCRSSAWPRPASTCSSPSRRPTSCTWRGGRKSRSGWCWWHSRLATRRAWPDRCVTSCAGSIPTCPPSTCARWRIFIACAQRASSTC
jgi:predicted permease